MRYPSLDEPWDGYGVLQAKLKETTGTNQDTSWFLGRVKAEMDAWTNPAKRRVIDGRVAEYLIFKTNVSLSGTGARRSISSAVGGHNTSMVVRLVSLRSCAHRSTIKWWLSPNRCGTNSARE